MHTDDLCSTVHFGEVVQFVNLFSLTSYIQGEKLKLLSALPLEQREQ